MTTINIEAELSGNVWKILVKPGDKVAEGETLLILESMKMEIPMLSTDAGKIIEIRVAENDTVSEGTIVVVLED